jgi:glycerol-1-phosphate dehydrogenase [NAD(P)+]
LAADKRRKAREEMSYQIITEKNDFLSRTSSGLANSLFHCPDCGREHKVPYRHILIGLGVRQQVAGLVMQAFGRSPKQVGVIYDRAIESMVNIQYLPAFRAGGLNIIGIPLGDEHTWLDSTREIGDATAHNIPQDVEFLIAVGSGVICDLTKWIATHSHRPFILCGTAPSMNGYTSITAVINEHDIKLTKYVDIPYAVVLDTEIIAQAPAKMIQAGVGDLAARAICNADWRLAQFLHDSYFCPVPYAMTRTSEISYLGAAENIAQADPLAVGQLVEAIAISGLSMSILDGETSPSSGGEHVISHYWDLMNHLEDAPRNFHGAQVGVGTMMMLAAYEYFRKLDPKRLDPEKIIRERLSLDQIVAMNNARFGAAATPLNETSRQKYLSEEKFNRLVHRAIDEWDALWAAITPYTGSLDSIRARLLAAGLPLTLSSVKRTHTQAIDAMLFGGRYRPRYTLLDLAWDLALFPQAAEEILDLSGVEKG